MVRTEYKIVEYPEGTFKAYRKGWFLWHCFTISDWEYAGDAVYDSLCAAEQAVIAAREEDRKNSIEPRIWYYGPY